MDYEVTIGEATAVLRRVAFFLPDAADGFTPQTGQAGNLAARVSKTGAATAAGTGSFTEIDSVNMPGMYYYEAVAGEVDTEGWLLLVFTCADCVTQRVIVRIGLNNTDIDSQLSSDVSASESNIRGGSDTLDSLSDQLDGAALETTAQNIKDKTDNLPVDPADQSAVEAAITASEGNIRGGSDTLDSLSGQVDTTALEANVQTNAAAALTAYDPPTRTEATADKDEILADIGELPEAILEESLTTHKAAANSMAYVLQLLKRRATGKVVRDEDKITVYDDDDTTVLVEIPVTDDQYGPPA